MPTPIDWDARLKQINRNLANSNGKTYGQVLGPATAVVPLDMTQSFFDRSGFLTWARTRIRFGEGADCTTQIIDQKNLNVTFSMSKEEIRTVSQTFARQATMGVTAGVSAAVEASVGNAVVGEVKASISSSLSASQESTNISSKTIEGQIKSAVSRSETLEMPTTPMECQRISAPYGLNLVVTVRGRVTIKRDVMIEVVDGTLRATGFQPATAMLSIKIDSSVDPAFEGTPTISAAPCQCCPGDEQSKSQSEKSSFRQAFSGTDDRSAPIRRQPSRLSGRSLRDLQGVGPQLKSRFQAIGVSTIDDLFSCEGEPVLDGVGSDQVRDWQDMAGWLIEYPQLDGNDAQLLVEGLGLRDVDDLDVIPLPDAPAVAAAIGVVELPDDYKPNLVQAVLDRANQAPSLL